MAPKNQPMMIVDDGYETSGPEYSIEDDSTTTDATDGEGTPFVYDEEAANLVETFESHPKGKKAKEKLIDQVLRDFDNAWESTETRRKKTADNWKLFTGDLPDKKWPFENCANAHVPIAFKAITRIVFRAFDEIFGEWGGFYRVLPVGPDDDAKAEILTKHGNWQLREVVTDFYRQQMRAMFLYFYTGDVVCHSYWDEINNCPAHEVLTGEDFVVPYSHVSTKPDYSDVPFRIKIMQKYRHELSRMKSTWSNVDKVLEREHASLDDEPEMLWRESAAKSAGVEIPSDQRAAPFKILWYEGWVDEDLLPGQDKPRFMRIIIEKNSQQMLCLSFHEEANWQEKRRYESQMSDLATYTQQLGDYNTQRQQMGQQRQQLEMAQMMGQVQDPIAHQEQLDQLDVTNLEPVIPPPWMQSPNVVGLDGMPQETPRKPPKVPIHTFTHGVCVEPIVGNLGMGYGNMLSDYGRASNVALSQFTDSATLANSWGIITAGNMEFDRPLSWGPGKVTVAKGVTGSQLKDAIHELKPQPGNTQLLDLINMFDGWSEQSAQAPGVLSGESGKSGETYRGISARLEQATKQLGVPTRVYAETVLKQILRNNGWLNSMFLADEEIVSVNNFMLGQAEELKLGRKLYERDYRVQIVADLRFASRVQRIAEADELVQLPASVPPLQQNVPYMQYALKKALVARGCWDAVPYLGPMQPPPETPLGLPPPAPPPQPGMPPDAAQGAPPPQQGAPPPQ